MNRPRQSATGFTLIEIMVALVLLTTALIVLAEGYVNTLNALRSGDERNSMEQEIAFVRERILQSNTREALEDGDTVETLTAGPARWEARLWETEVLDVFRLRVRIEFLDEDEVFVEEVHVLRPQWSEPIKRERILQEKREALENSRFGKEWAF